MDEVDLDNYKGIFYAEQPGTKYVDSTTGAHFEYRDMCLRLKGLQRLQLRQDLKPGPEVLVLPRPDPVFAHNLAKVVAPAAKEDCITARRAQHEDEDQFSTVDGSNRDSMPQRRSTTYLAALENPASKLPTLPRTKLPSITSLHPQRRQEDRRSRNPDRVQPPANTAKKLTSRGTVRLAHLSAMMAATCGDVKSVVGSVSQKSKGNKLQPLQSSGNGTAVAAMHGKEKRGNVVVHKRVHKQTKPKLL